VRCENPVFVGKGIFKCGKCQPCRRAHGALWAHRIMLESFTHAENSFVTLTFNEDNCPVDVSVRDVQLFIKRLRKLCSASCNSGGAGGAGVRYFAVGEYGDYSGRPHYHLAIFGYGCSRGAYCECAVPNSGRRVVICQCAFCCAVRKAWTFGHSMVGTLSFSSAAYVSRYVLKKWTRPCSDLNGRKPEFARMSLRPGIGADAVLEIAESLIESGRWDLPSGLKSSKTKFLPLGRYLRGRLSEVSGRTVPGYVEPEALRVLRAYAFEKSISVKKAYEEACGISANQIYQKRELKRETI